MESEELQALETASGSGLLERFFDREVDAGGARMLSKSKSLPDFFLSKPSHCPMTAIWIEKKMLPIHGLKRGGSNPTATRSMKPLLSPLLHIYRPKKPKHYFG